MELERRTLKQRVATVFDKLSFETVKKCLDSKTPWSALKGEATKHNVRLITVTERDQKAAGGSGSSAKREVDPLQENDPGKVGTAKGSKKSQRKDKPKAVLKIDDSFFHVQGKELPVITIDDLMKGSSGLVIEPLDAVSERLQVILQRSRTTGPAAVIVCGCSVADLPRDVNSAKCTDVVVPGWVGPHSSAIRSVLIQVGDVEVKYKETKTELVVEDHSATKVVMIHVYKDESDQWAELQKGLAYYLRRLGFQDSKMIQQVWGLSFYAGNKKVTPSNAVYAHGFLRIIEAFVVPLLQLSGKGWYVRHSAFICTTRSTQRIRSSVFLASIWRMLREQVDLLDEVVGLVRTAKGYGVRVKASRYSVTKEGALP